MSIQSAVEIYRSNPEIAKQSQQKMQELLTRSATDAEFRRKLLTEPRAALAEFAGHEVPEFNIVFIENTADATIVLPPAVDPASELSEADLEAVAGGITPTVVPVVVSALELTAATIGLTIAIAACFDGQ